MYRKMEAEFEQWRKDSKKKALFVSGARQTGKTYLIRELGKKYKKFVEINFVAQPDAIGIFDGSLDANTILLNLTAFTQEKIIPGETLIFFDEIQECPNARTAIKFLVEDGRFDYVESGSLLGVRYKSVKSYPVGFEHRVVMYPMDFEEFCIANGVQENIIVYLKDCYDKGSVVSESIHSTMQRLFRYYVVTGGMPEAVERFMQTHDMEQVISIQNDILSLYRQDISKYALENRNRITQIFDYIPSQLDQKNRRFQLSSIHKNARSREYENSFLWLQDAGVALPCLNVVEPKVPLKMNEQARLFKLFLNDSGLLCCASMEHVQYAILQGDLSVNMGSILENVFAQQLKSNGFELRYYNKHGIGKLDFLVQKNQKIIPIEIKSGKDYKKHAALNNVLNVEEWKLEKGIVFCQGNVEISNRIKLLEPISEWKNANELIQQCNEKIEEIKKKEEAERLERERIAEEKRIESEKRRQQSKKMALITSSVVCVGIVIALIVNFVVIPNMNYKNAIKLIDEGNIKEGYEAFFALNGYKDSEEKANEAFNQYVTTLDVGDTFTFGKYEQDNDTKNGKENIEWIILAKEDNRIFVISKYGLDCQQYNKEYEDITWENSTIRSWLNNEFKDEAFNNEQKGMIPTVTVKADQNPNHATNPGNDTEDQIFLLSIKEVEEYLPSVDNRKCMVTEYAKEQGAYSTSDNTGYWWLRSPGSHQYDAAHVLSNGNIGTSGNIVNYDSGAVRPALWINLES